MGRPKKTGEERQVVSVRLPVRVVEEIDAAAARAGMTRTGYVESKLSLEHRPRDPLPLIEVLADDPGTCPHPKKDRKVFGWGSKCEACGAVVR
jgi:hypothetical protein